MKPAIVVVDMLMDNLHSGEHTPIGRQGMAIVPAIRRVLAACRASGIPVVYANDSFLLRVEPAAEFLARWASPASPASFPSERR